MNIYFANYDRNGMTVVEESKYQHAVGRQLLKTALLRAGVSKDFLSKEESLKEHPLSDKANATITEIAKSVLIGFKFFPPFLKIKTYTFNPF